MLFVKQKPTDPTSKKTFRKLTDFDDYVESRNRLDKLTEQRRELQSNVDNLTAEIGEGDSDNEGIRERASEMLAGATATLIAHPKARSELNTAREKLAVVTEAISMQSDATKKVADTCRGEMIQERRPAHAAIVGRMNDALTALDQAIADERSFRSQSSDDGLKVYDHIPMIPLPSNFGYQRGTSWENFHQWRLKMARVGYLKYDGRR